MATPSAFASATANAELMIGLETPAPAFPAHTMKTKEARGKLKVEICWSYSAQYVLEPADQRLSIPPRSV